MEPRKDVVEIKKVEDGDGDGDDGGCLLNESDQ